jgi:cysteine desulfurase / selenocysteine lyase
MMAIGEGDEIVLSIMEHHSNIVPWHFHRERKGAVIKWAPVADDGTFLVEEFEKLLTERTKIVAITHMSNVLGTVVPIKEVCRIAHERGIPCWSTAARARCTCRSTCRTRLRLLRLHRPQALRPDRHRRALRQEGLKAMPPFHGRRRDDRRRDRGASPTPSRRTASRPARRRSSRRSGSAPRSTTWRRSAASGSPRTRRAARLCARAPVAINSLRIYGTAPGKGAIVAFNMAGAHPHDVSMVIDRAGVAVRAGTHCAQPLLARYGVTATCRASFALYNTWRKSTAGRGAAEAHEFFA